MLGKVKVELLDNKVLRIIGVNYSFIDGVKLLYNLENIKLPNFNYSVAVKSEYFIYLIYIYWRGFHYYVEYNIN